MTLIRTAQSFIEVQFPISKLSKECYKERKSQQGQTLTGLGKWWGRKPLILVRAALFGLLLPASSDPAADRRIFLKLLTMDEDGLWLRRTRPIPVAKLADFASRQKADGDRPPWDEGDSEGWFINSGAKVIWRNEVSREQRSVITRWLFDGLSYEEKHEFCVRPEEIEGPAAGSWAEINGHLGTQATNLGELVEELGRRRFGHLPRVGDAFCGGGSIPFEAARLGCEVYASDLNPVAALLTWGALNLVGAGPQAAAGVVRARNALLAAGDERITSWGIEHNALGWRADLYYYCYETICPDCGWRIPLAGSWSIAERSQQVLGLLEPDSNSRSFRITIKENATREELKRAKLSGTLVDGLVRCPSPDCAKREVPAKLKVSTLRGDRRKGKEEVEYGIRAWDAEQVVAGPDDLYQERLYCIRWLVPPDGATQGATWKYCQPDAEDFERERKVHELLMDRIGDWRSRGVLPTTPIRPGAKTTPLRRDLGATAWSHLFNPRQLLVLGLLVELMETRSLEVSGFERRCLLLMLGSAVNHSSRLCGNDPSVDYAHWTLYSQAFSAVYNYACRSWSSLETPMKLPRSVGPFRGNGTVATENASEIETVCDLWITDPPYADAINYHELCDFFLSWYRGPLEQLFPEWYTDGRHALAVVGKVQQFRRVMGDIYRSLTEKMPDDGLQVVMFTHTDAGVWADLALILWSAGLQVTAAWCISTEAGSVVAQKEGGNYVQGTVLLVLRKRLAGQTVFLDELFPMVENEVRRQLDSMRQLEDTRDPNFSDADYQLAAYAAAMKVLTAYSAIEDFDISRELMRSGKENESSPIENLIRQAVETACNHLVPEGLDPFAWKQLTAAERYYLKGLDVESRGEAHLAAYQELARGFRFAAYKSLVCQKANAARLKTASELGKQGQDESGFGSSLVRSALFAVFLSVGAEDAREGKGWLRTELPNYWNQRRLLVEVLNYLGRLADVLPHWKFDGEMARTLAGAVDNDHV